MPDSLLRSTDPTESVLPPATIGMVGGGQLGRMFAMAAASMGYRVVVFCESDQAPAAQVASTVVGSLTDAVAVEKFASQCDVITLEFENIPAETIAQCAKFAPTYPAASILATAQDRLREKRSLSAAGLPVTPFSEVHNAETLAATAEKLGWPLIVKTAHSGYDGKGQQRVESTDEAATVPWDQCDSWVAEQCIDFDFEVSVIVARNVSGQCECFPIFENSHRNHILDLTVAPASMSESLASETRRVAIAAAQSLDVVGLLCVEFFVCGGAIMINEVAPRPHNSGHLTIEACETSQFEQHVRAVCNLPLGRTDMRCPWAAMVNLLGDLWRPNHDSPAWDAVVGTPGVSLHLYGKQQAKPGRKMGHLTAIGNERDEVVARVHQARDGMTNVQ